MHVKITEFLHNNQSIEPRLSKMHLLKPRFLAAAKLKNLLTSKLVKFMLFTLKLVTKRLFVKLVTLAYGLCLLSISAHSSSSNLVVLQYHHVSSTTPPSTSVNLETFKTHLKLLEQLDFKVRSFSSVIDQIKQGEPFTARTAVITFDDGYMNIYNNAFPELKKRNWPFTIFISPEPHIQNNKSFLTVVQMKEMEKFGAEYGNHSWDHGYLVRRHQGESEAQWLERIRKSLSDTELWLKKTFGGSNQLFAYPFGEFDKALIDIVTSLNLIGVGQHSGPISTEISNLNLASLPRFPASGIYSNTETLKTKLLTQAFPNLTESSRDFITNNTKPDIIFSLPRSIFKNSKMNCFGSGVGPLAIERIKNQSTKKEQLTFKIRPKKPLSLGRNRYNCTLRIEGTNNYYWHSFPWIIVDSKR